MRGLLLPGNSTVELRDLPDPSPGHGQVVLAMRASAICGSDVRAIYREHIGTGAEAYAGVVAGHEPCGEVVAVGPGVQTARIGDRMAVYHISGCGLCDECRKGYQISCTGPGRAAYGWQRDGGHADYLLAEERDLVRLPDGASWLDGACAACGGSTSYEALCRVAVSGRDRVLITGLGPVGLFAGRLAQAMGASQVVGTDPSAGRRALAESTGCVHVAVAADGLPDTLGDGAEVSIDCSGSGAGQLTALQHTARWGRVALVGEGGQLAVDVSQVIIHKQLTIHGSWVSSTQGMRRLLELLGRWDIHLDDLVTDTFALSHGGDAYRVADAGQSGKAAIVWPG